MLRELGKGPLPPDERVAFEQTIVTARAALDAVCFEEAWATGAAFKQDEAIGYALSEACA